MYAFILRFTCIHVYIFIYIAKRKLQINVGQERITHTHREMNARKCRLPITHTNPTGYTKLRCDY